jgi:hypothetical protein
MLRTAVIRSRMTCPMVWPFQPRTHVGPQAVDHGRLPAGDPKWAKNSGNSLVGIRLVAMKTLSISTVEIDASGGLLVQPRASDSYEYIYREANGLRWDGQRRAIHAYEPSRWGHEELLLHIAATLRDCCDENLVFTDETSWVGVSTELQDRLRNVLPSQ